MGCLPRACQLLTLICFRFWILLLICLKTLLKRILHGTEPYKPEDSNVLVGGWGKPKAKSAWAVRGGYLAKGDSYHLTKKNYRYVLDIETSRLNRGDSGRKGGQVPGLPQAASQLHADSKTNDQWFWPNYCLSIGIKALIATELICPHGYREMAKAAAIPMPWYGRILFPLFHGSFLFLLKILPQPGRIHTPEFHRFPARTYSPIPIACER